MNRARRRGLSLALACALGPLAACYSSYGRSSDGAADAGTDAGRGLVGELVRHAHAR